MASFAETGPRKPIVESIRVDKVHPSSRRAGAVRALVVLAIALIMLIPLFVMIITAFKTRSDVVASPPLVVFKPTLEGFMFLFTDRAVVAPTRMEEFQQRMQSGQMNIFEQLAFENGQEITGPSPYVKRILNSIIIAGLSTIFSVVLGVLSGYAFSRFNMPGKDDLLFFILSTRMLPAVVVTIPLFLMYRQLSLHDTQAGMIILYTVFNLSFSVWLMKGFIDEIPREYEEAALVDGLRAERVVLADVSFTVKDPQDAVEIMLICTNDAQISLGYDEGYFLCNQHKVSPSGVPAGTYDAKFSSGDGHIKVKVRA